MPEFFLPRQWPDMQGEFFDRAVTLGATPAQNGWTVADTSAAGTPTYVHQNKGGVVLTCAATSEAENVCLYQNDVLIFDIDDLQTMEFIAKVSGIDAVTQLVMGLASARNDTPDSVTANIWFKMDGTASTSNVVVESDDNVNDNDDKATGVTLSTTPKKFTIDFTKSKTDVRFYIDGARVGTGTTFDVSNYTAGVQPLFQVQKASGTGVPAVTIEWMKITTSRQQY